MRISGYKSKRFRGTQEKRIMVATKGRDSEEHKRRESVVVPQVR
jgi:hypothetical protein